MRVWTKMGKWLDYARLLGEYYKEVIKGVGGNPN